MCTASRNCKSLPGKSHRAHRAALSLAGLVAQPLSHGLLDEPGQLINPTPPAHPPHNSQLADTTKCSTMSAATSVDKAQLPNFGYAKSLGILPLTTNLNSELLSSPMVTIKASKEGESKTYLVHKPLVMHYSGYFRNALGSENFKEGVTGEVRKTCDDYDC